MQSFPYVIKAPRQVETAASMLASGTGEQALRIVHTALAFLIVAALAAISPPAISFYYNTGGTTVASLPASVAARDDVGETRLAAN